MKPALQYTIGRRELLHGMVVSAATAFVMNTPLGLTIANAASSSLSVGQQLRPGDSLVSPSGKYVLTMQKADGNCVLSRSGQPLWASRTEGHPGASLFLQPDGNAVIYDAHGRALWDSKSFWLANAGFRRPVFRVQDDGNVVLYNGRSFEPRDAVWNSGTWRSTGRTLGNNPFYAYYGNCTYGAEELFKANEGFYIDVGGGNAATWADGARARGWRVIEDATLQVVYGIVVIQQGGWYGVTDLGHVGWVRQVNLGAGKIYVSHWNTLSHPLAPAPDSWMPIVPGKMSFVLAP